MKILLECIGTGLMLLLGLAGFFKKLRSDRLLQFLLALSVIPAVAGILLRSPDYQAKEVNTADSLLCPFTYLACYILLRNWYKKKYNREPTYYRSSWHDPEEKREQNVFDLAVFLVPLIVAALLPVVVTSVARVLHLA